jgi:hypothetical protein
MKFNQLPNSNHTNAERKAWFAMFVDVSFSVAFLIRGEAGNLLYMYCSRNKAHSTAQFRHVRSCFWLQRQNLIVNPCETRSSLRLHVLALPSCCQGQKTYLCTKHVHIIGPSARGVSTMCQVSLKTSEGKFWLPHQNFWWSNWGYAFYLQVKCDTKSTYINGATVKTNKQPPGLRVIVQRCRSNCNSKTNIAFYCN